MPVLGFVVAATGLAAEARIAARSEGVKAFACGGDGDRLRTLLEAQLASGARGIISFGIAGALAPNLQSGAIVIGTAVIAPGKTYEANRAWADGLAAKLPPARKGKVFGSPFAIGEPAAKAELYRAAGAIAADMESHVVAELAASHGLPFAVLRVVADSADQALPPAAIAGLKPDGTPDIAAVMKSLAGNPAQLGDLIRAGLATRRAMAALFRCHRLLGPGLGCADFG